jgi:hypothetical protein
MLRPGAVAQQPTAQQARNARVAQPRQQLRLSAEQRGDVGIGGDEAIEDVAPRAPFAADIDQHALALGPGHRRRRREVPLRVAPRVELDWQILRDRGERNAKQPQQQQREGARVTVGSGSGHRFSGSTGSWTRWEA